MTTPCSVAACMSRVASCSTATDIGVVNRVLLGDAINHATSQHHAGRLCMVGLCGANSSIRTERPCTVDPPDAAKSRDRSHPHTGRHRTLPSTQCTDATPPPPHPQRLSIVRVLELVSGYAWLHQPQWPERKKKVEFATQWSRICAIRTDTGAYRDPKKQQKTLFF